MWLQTLSDSDDTVVFLENGATITGGNPASNDAVRTRTDLPTTGDASHKVDGTSTPLVDEGKNLPGPHAPTGHVQFRRYPVHRHLVSRHHRAIAE